MLLTSKPHLNVIMGLNMEKEQTNLWVAIVELLEDLFN